MKKTSLVLVAILVIVGYYIWRKSKQVIDTTKTVSDPALAEVMPDDPDLH